VRALTVRLAEKDEYTAQHTRRVALLAVQVGEALGLSAGRLRALAIGGLVHDIGKLSVPDAILKKPSALDDGEYAVIKRHPDWEAACWTTSVAFRRRCGSSYATTTSVWTEPATHAG
jgi:HD-GYP domain-containing protein (c-di-GMP phosphodiesterase class II)